MKTKRDIKSMMYTGALSLVWLLVLMGEMKRTRCEELKVVKGKKYTEEEAKGYIAKVQERDEIWCNKLSNAGWDYDSNLTDYNLQKQMNLSAEYAKIYRESWKEIIKFDWKHFKDPSLKRMFKLYSELGTAALEEKERSKLEKVVADMSDIYSTMKLWEFPESSTAKKPTEPTINLEPELVEIFTKDVGNPCKLQYYWEGWHSSVGRKVKDMFNGYVELSNKAAKLNNFTNNADMWNEDFEMKNFEEEMQRLFDQITPLYKQLHAYVRRKLIEHHKVHNPQLIQKDGCLPAHILGNPWAQEWEDIYNITMPFKGKSSMDVTSVMKAQKYTPTKMFKMAEEFYTSINMSAMTPTFWKKSIIEKPNDRKLVCHASAWNFCTRDDFRIKICTRVDFTDFKTIHHEMGHIEYYMQYRDQPYVFRGGADSGFHEAVGDTMALSVSTAQHLIKVGLLDGKNYKEDKETEINALYQMALEKVAFLPFAYVLDLWRWEIFKNKITPKQYNCRYWELRQKLQGIIPPVDRSELDFDAGAKYHVISDVPYIRYFVSFVIQFQFHKALCIKAGQYDPKNPTKKPLHHCDIYQHKEAGNLFKKMLSLGGSKPPQDALKVLTGQSNMDAKALLEYFKPLQEWLEKENAKSKEKIGWNLSGSEIKCQGDGKVKTRSAGIDKNKNCFYDFTKKSEEKSKPEKS